MIETSEKVKILSDVNIHVTEHRRPDIVVVEKDNKTTVLIDITVFRDTRGAGEGAEESGQIQESDTRTQKVLESE